MRNTEPGEKAANEIARRVVGFHEADDVVALLREGQQCLGDGANTRSTDETLLTPLHLGQQQLELSCRGVRGARVEESRALAPEKPLRLIQRVETGRAHV